MSSFWEYAKNRKSNLVLESSYKRSLIKEIPRANVTQYAYAAISISTSRREINKASG